MRRALVAAHQRPEHSLPKPLRPNPKCWEWSLGLYIPSTEAARSGWAATIDTKLGWIRACASLAPRCKSVLVARSLDRFTRHTQSFNLYALLTLPFGQTLAMVAARWIEVAEALKEEITGERGPWRASQPEQSQIFYSTLRDGTARGSLVYLH